MQTGRKVFKSTTGKGPGGVDPYAAQYYVNYQKQKEMTLDCSFFTPYTVKGHFCSLLISNILG